MRVLLAGITPPLYPGGPGRLFAGPATGLGGPLHGAVFPHRRPPPAETDAIVTAGLGITNLVARATARADELSADEIRAGVRPLARLVRRRRPAFVAFLGVSTYRIAFARRGAQVGRPDEAFEGAAVWVLPNPSGLNAHYQQPALTAAYGELRAAAHLP